MAQTFASLIRELAHMVGAVKYDGIATAGSTTTLTDAITLAGLNDDALNGLSLYIWKGTGIGQERVITDHAGSAGVLTFASGTAPTATSEYIILENGWRVQTLRAALITALRARRRFYYLPKVDTSLTLAAPAGAITYAYTVPADFEAIHRILVEVNAGDSDFWNTIPPDAWFINKAATRQIVFEKLANDRFQFIKDGHALRIHGQQFETEPTADSSNITIPTGVVLRLAASTALNAARTRDANNSQGYGQLANIYWQEYLTMRQDDEIPAWPGSKFVNE